MLFKRQAIIFTLVLASFTWGTATSAHTLVSVNADIGAIAVPEGMLRVKLLGVYVNGSIAPGYLLSLDGMKICEDLVRVGKCEKLYTVSYSYTYENIDPLISALVGAQAELPHKRKYKQQIQLRGSRSHEADMMVKVTADGLVKVTFISGFSKSYTATLSSKDVDEYVQQLQRAKQVLAYLAPKFNAFADVPPDTRIKADVDSCAHARCDERRRLPVSE